MPENQELIQCLVDYLRFNDSNGYTHAYFDLSSLPHREISHVYPPEHQFEDVVSVDRSSFSTSLTRHTPPHAHASLGYSSQPQAYYSQPPPPLNHHHGHQGYEVFQSSYAAPNAPPPMTGAPPVRMGMATGGMATGGMAAGGMPSTREPYGLHKPRYRSGVMPVNFPATPPKLSDQVGKRCFNCCTTHTVLWRRSKLNPGKKLCNQCDLIERTHLRSRPEQYPQGGPLATSALQSLSLPSPPHTESSSRAQQSQHSKSASQDASSSNTLPPYSYSYSHRPHPAWLV
ncbi:hypothetical protein GYMLUDRAFT_263534 [Collybiopsis luxurians FD-317 M1]|uniref:GATA-type domain-containing protein n=1 Tax=Collybiopsis luxurians FD-317 M1 TaxID=944289 RepID=A0A0D0C2R4_9AGAR|nr:hypothetical protein GYMLUDRAFT_263534 [Collybiopsis luxurians FD-317 M1]